MRYWAFDHYYLDTSTSSIELESGRKVWINAGDHLIFFHRDYSDILFNSFGSIEDTSLEVIDDARYKFNAKVQNFELFEDSRHLGDFSYSLQKIYRYIKPFLHFRRPYISLSKNDFQTIKEAKIYWARTAFGYFINQLPREHIVRFMNRLSISDPDILLQQSDYKRAWKALHNFIEQEYVSAANLFKKIRDQVESVNSILDVELDYSKLGFSTDIELYQPDFVQNQEVLFSEFTDQLSIQEAEAGLLGEIDIRVEESESLDENFDEIFRGTAWPIQMIED